MTRPATLGLDVGGVLVDRVAEGSDTSFFGDRPMDTPPVPGALEAVDRLVEVFSHRVHIVSKAGPKISALTRRWLGEQGLTSARAIAPGNVHFVRKRPAKAPICEQLGITHFVDDRADVLDHLAAVENRYLFSGGLGDNDLPTVIPDGVILVETWPRLVDLLIRDLHSHP